MFEELTRLLTHPLTTALLELIEDDDDDGELLVAAHYAWRDRTGNSEPDFVFINAVKVLTGAGCIICGDCHGAVWDSVATSVNGDYQVCDDCFENYGQCDSCREWVTDTSSVNNDNAYYCDGCLSNYCTYCDECEGYFSDSSEHDHRHDCDCEAPRRSFKFPADGHGLITENERLTVELPKGTIDDEGIGRIRRLIFTSLTDNWGVIDEVLNEIGSLWQAKRGNFTRRLSNGLYKRGVKLEPGVISEIGNLARAHSSEGSAWNVELTRDLNASAEEFYHEESCWWGGYAYSRCSLKNWGGIGMRTYDSESETYYPNGRAWVQPLNEDLQPTHDAENAHAYVVFNGYGELEGYIAARIIAHLSSRSYKKIGLGADRQYVNGDSGYLVADEATCAATEHLFFGFHEHDQRDAHTFDKEEVAA